jgi:metal iron transporter
MNCPSRTEEPEGTGFNQNPSALSADLTTRQDLNGRANSRVLRRIASSEIQDVVECVPDDDSPRKREASLREKEAATTEKGGHVGEMGTSSLAVSDENNGEGGSGNWLLRNFMRVRKFLITYAKFVGPGFMVCRLPNSECPLLIIRIDISGIH